jgi:4-amino-4-deoxychorismate lyase
MSLLVESIKVADGKLLNISLHNERMIRTLYVIYGIRNNYRLEEQIVVPDTACTGIYKCRVLYDDRSFKIEFLPYSVRKIMSLKIVSGDEVCYPYKYTDRTKIDRLFEMRGDCDDIIIVKNDKVTDSSYANLVFRDNNGEWVTPATYLLPGTKRAFLLKNRMISEQEISLSDLKKYSEVKLINAMIDIEESVGISIENIH